MLEALRGREHKIDHEAHFFYLAHSHPLSPSLCLFPHSLPSLSSLAYLTGEAGLHLSFNCIVVTLSSNNSQVEVSLQSHLSCALSHRSLLSAAITQSVISKSTGWSVNSAKVASCHQAITFSNGKSWQCKGELAPGLQTTRRRAWPQY